MPDLFRPRAELLVQDLDGNVVGGFKATLLEVSHDRLEYRFTIRAVDHGSDLAKDLADVAALRRALEHANSEVRTLKRTVDSLLDILERDGQNLVDTARQIRGVE